jgi:uncharacterized protein YbbC (DUF1343 family)
MPLRILPGIDTWLARKSLSAKTRIGLVTNDAALTATGLQSRIALLKTGFNLVTIFSPEHGIRVKGEDGVLQRHGTDSLTGLPVTSLYSEKMAPSEDDLKQLDAVLFDIPDIGCRFYTYLWTMTYVMEACATFNKPFIVLDRPNPIGALLEHAEGPMLDEVNCSSFIGRWDIPLKHACTLGELALFFAATRFPKLEIEVIRVDNYHRHQTAMQHFKFVPTSPAIQNINAAMLYPGSGLWEGIMVNEGRGTDKPFEQLGAPWISNEELCEVLTYRVTGVELNHVQFIPRSGVYEGECCEGISFQVRDPYKFKAVQFGLTLLAAIFELYPEVSERLYKTHANPSGVRHMDMLLGQPDVLRQLRKHNAVDVRVAESWYTMMTSFLLYK